MLERPQLELGIRGWWRAAWHRLHQILQGFPRPGGGITLALPTRSRSSGSRGSTSWPSLRRATSS